MAPFKFAMAQVPAIKGSVQDNINIHLRAVSTAAWAGVSLIVFPELSLTGYEPELAGSLAFDENDDRLVPLISAAAQHRIHIIAGAPLKGKSKPHIGALIISPSGLVSSYSKINLHSSEEQFFSPGNEHRVITIDTHTIGVAICADTNAPEHIKPVQKKVRHYTLPALCFRKTVTMLMRIN